MSFFERNSYHVLGLDASANQKEISKRAKEIATRLKIEDVPVYDIDLHIFSDYRDEASVKEAVSKLSNPKKQIKEYFFWFQVADKIDEQAIGLLRTDDYEEALRIWEHHSSEDTAKSLLYKKNLAVLLSALLYKEKNADYLSKSILLWRELVDSDKFWKTFEKIYKLQDELGAHDELISELRTGIQEDISDIYSELSVKYADKEYAAAFSNSFGLKGKKLEKDVIDPIYVQINEVVEKLEALKISEDGVFDDDEKAVVKKLLKKAQEEFNKLVDLGVYDSGQVKTIRDRFSNALRTIVLDLHNNLDDYLVSAKFLEIAISFCGTEGLKNKLEQELKQIEKNIEGAADSNLVLEIPATFTTNYLKMDNKGVEYKGKRVNFADAIKVSWHSVKNSTNGIPTGQTYTFAVSDERDTLRASFSAAFRGGDKHNETFGRLVAISNSLIEPVIIEKLVKQIFDKGETITIGTLHINNRGFYKNKMFGGIDELLWAQVEYIPKLHQGDTHVFTTNKKGEASTFLTIPMSTANAVLVPELITECIRRSK